MRYLFIGLIMGAILNIFFLSSTGGTELIPEFTSSINRIDHISRTTSADCSTTFPLKTDKNFYLVKCNGALSGNIPLDNSLVSFSGNGNYFMKFEKVGTEVEFYNIKGERFWKQDSREYPYLSANGRLVFMLIGDHSRVRIIDHNGNEIGERVIVGRMCTVISFSETGDFGGIGFLDGSYYVIDERGKVLFRGKAPEGNIVKGIAVSGNGRFSLVHYGNSERDHVSVVDISEMKFNTFPLNHAHKVKTGLHVNGSGIATVIDVNSIIQLKANAGLNFRLEISPKRGGLSSISMVRGLYAVSYTRAEGDSKLILFRDDGTVIFSRDYSGESFLTAVLKDNFIFLRGSDNLYCYSFYHLNVE